jgi:hypothetical protein
MKHGNGGARVRAAIGTAALLGAMLLVPCRLLAADNEAIEAQILAPADLGVRVDSSLELAVPDLGHALHAAARSATRLIAESTARPATLAAQARTMVLARSEVQEAPAVREIEEAPAPRPAPRAEPCTTG